MSPDCSFNPDPYLKEILNNLESEFYNILDQNLIVDHIDSVINSEISSKFDQIKDFKNYKI